MSYARFQRRIRSIASRVRAKAYVGLSLMVLGLTVLAFGQCPHSNGAHRPRPLHAPVMVSRGQMPKSVEYGNAQSDGSSRKGWWVGHFMRIDSPRYSSQIETKWISHSKGKKHTGFSTNKIAKSMAILISGKHRIEFEEAYVQLERPGDYVLWGPEVAHSWSAMEDSTMLCIRWPSISGDQIDSVVKGSRPHATVALLNRSINAESKLPVGISLNASTELGGTGHAA